EYSNWHIPFQEYPDGSYALFRDGEKYCEIVSDPAASRTIWYYKNEENFVASTSQIAIIKFIEGFEFDERVIPWMLSTGTLGPSYSWDRRIGKVPPNSSVILHKHNWFLEKRISKILFEVHKGSKKLHEKKLKEKLFSTINSMKVNYSDWVLPLSGGYDSRVILCAAKTNYNKDIKTITWGVESSLNDSKSDAFIAQKLAKELKVPHKFYPIELSVESAEKIFNRFITNGEGRIDHIQAYVDGFKMWKVLHEDNVQGIIRGDEGFGWKKVSSIFTARHSVGLRLCSDYINLKRFQKNGFLQQEIPAYLRKAEHESVNQWRDRLYHEFRVPTYLAALSDLKLSYVEQVTPLLSLNILDQVRSQPDRLRTDKYLFKKIVNSLSPKIPYAKRESTVSFSSFLEQEEVASLLRQEIKNNLENDIFPKDFLNHVLENIKISNKTKKKNRAFYDLSVIKSKLPSFIKNIVIDNISSTSLIDYNRLGFRIYIVLRMHNIFKK
ncbi:MAG: asparagine synthase-related protein, partial [bacterium]